MNFGSDPESKPANPALKKRTSIDFGWDDTDFQPKPIRYRKPSTIVVAAFLEQWDQLTHKRPEYVMQVVMNKAAFSNFLNNTFFGEGNFSAEDVVRMINTFISDIEHGNIALHPSMPVWKAFARHWRKYVLQDDSNTGKVSSLLERLQANEWKT